MAVLNGGYLVRLLFISLLDLFKKGTREMNNKPVAWMNKDDSSLSFKNHGNGWQPLYTHPAKTLTADEITLLVDKIVNPDGCDIFTLIRAVEEAHGIRKAQE